MYTFRPVTKPLILIMIFIVYVSTAAIRIQAPRDAFIQALILRLDVPLYYRIIIM